MMERKYKREARIGIFGVVHATYYGQLEGLKDKLEGYLKKCAFFLLTNGEKRCRIEA